MCDYISRMSFFYLGWIVTFSILNVNIWFRSVLNLKATPGDIAYRVTGCFCHIRLKSDMVNITHKNWFSIDFWFDTWYLLEAFYNTSLLYNGTKKKYDHKSMLHLAWQGILMAIRQVQKSSFTRSVLYRHCNCKA